MLLPQLRLYEENILKILFYQKDLCPIYGLRIWALSLGLEWWPG